VKSFFVAQEAADHGAALVEEGFGLVDLVDGGGGEKLVAGRAGETEDLAIGVFDELAQDSIAEAVDLQLARGMPTCIGQNRQQLLQPAIGRQLLPENRKIGLGDHAAGWSL